MGLATQKFTGPFLWISCLINEVKQASALDEGPGWAFPSAGKVSDLELQSFWVLGKEWGQMGQSGLSGFFSFVGSASGDPQDNLRVKETEDFTNSS